MKAKILKHLSTEPRQIISGQELSEKLGVSRVSVWKHIKKLQELGYGIHSSAKGYHLEFSPDALYAWEFPGRESTVHYFQEVSSTMERAKELARKGCPGFTIVIAERQSEGRGRLRRVWRSGVGGLYFTVVIRMVIPPTMMSRISFAASLSLARVLREEYRLRAAVKWPNDLLVDEKKISGMLCEMEVESDMVSFLNIGIGLNVNNDPTKEEPNAISMKRLLGREVSRKEVLRHFLKTLEAELSGESLDTVISRWKEYTVTLGRQVKIVTTSDVTEGMAVDVDEMGALVLRLEDGTTKKIFYGDCFHQA